MKRWNGALEEDEGERSDAESDACEEETSKLRLHAVELRKWKITLDQLAVELIPSPRATKGTNHLGRKKGKARGEHAANVSKNRVEG